MCCRSRAPSRTRTSSRLGLHAGRTAHSWRPGGSVAAIAVPVRAAVLRTGWSDRNRTRSYKRSKHGSRRHQGARVRRHGLRSAGSRRRFVNVRVGPGPLRRPPRPVAGQRRPSFGDHVLGCKLDEICPVETSASPTSTKVSSPAVNRLGVRPQSREGGIDGSGCPTGTGRTGPLRSTEAGRVLRNRDRHVRYLRFAGEPLGLYHERPTSRRHDRPCRPRFATSPRRPGHERRPRGIFSSAPARGRTATVPAAASCSPTISRYGIFSMAAVADLGPDLLRAHAGRGPQAGGLQGAPSPPRRTRPTSR